MTKKKIMQIESLSDDENWLNYREVGRKVFHYRKICGFSQAKLAEMIDISTTHLSHIETGATKLSLPVFIKLSRALCVSTEALLPDAAMPDVAARSDFDLRRSLINELHDQLTGCSTSELRILSDLTAATILSLRKYGA